MKVKPQVTYAVEESKFFEATRKKWLVYGDNLSLLELDIGALPEGIRLDFSRTTHFYEEVKGLLRNSLENFAPLVLLKAGYLNYYLTDIDFDHEEQVGFFKSTGWRVKKIVHGTNESVYLPAGSPEEDLNGGYREFYRPESSEPNIVLYSLHQ